MRVVSQDEFGSPSVLHLAERPVPEPLPTEVRVRVLAAGVNPVDCKTRSGAGVAAILGRPPFVLGWDVCGVVDSLGKGVTRYGVGSLVYGMPWFPREAGAYAEYVTAPSRQFALAPTSLDARMAAALPLASLTAWHAVVDTARVECGQHVLVHAAAGGVGHLAVQLLKWRGAIVTATARTTNHSFLRQLGADEVVDYQTQRFEHIGKQYDVVLDLVGGEYAFRSLETIRRDGLLLTIPSDSPHGLFAAAKDCGIRATGMLVEPDGAALSEIASLVDNGHLRVRVADILNISRVQDAHRLIENGHVRGKLVLDLD